MSTPYFNYDSSFRPSDANEERFLILLVEALQKRAILKAKNESFNQIIFNNLVMINKKQIKVNSLHLFQL